jgi:hypothetical protein
LIGPQITINETAAASRTPSPNPRIKLDTTKATYEVNTPDGQKRKVPQA